MITPVLERSLRKGRRVEADWIHDAVQDAVMEFRVNFRRFDPARGVPLMAFLWTAANRNLLNRIDRERRRSAHESTEDSPGSAVRRSGAAPCYEVRLDLARAVSAVWARLTQVERKVFGLIVKGEDRTEVLAEAAHVSHLPRLERQREVKRITNRIFQRLRRLYRGDKQQK